MVLTIDWRLGCPSLGRRIGAARSTACLVLNTNRFMKTWRWKHCKQTRKRLNLARTQSFPQLSRRVTLPTRTFSAATRKALTLSTFRLKHTCPAIEQ